MYRFLIAPGFTDEAVKVIRITSISHSAVCLILSFVDLFISLGAS